MAAVAPAADQATDLVQKLSLGSQTKAHDVSEVTKKPNGSVHRGNVANVPVPSSEWSMSPFLLDFMDPNMCYVPNRYGSPAYYYGAYDSSINKWEDCSRYVNPDDISSVYGDMYHHSYGYATYGAYAPPGLQVPTTGHDSQHYGSQHYQYPGLYYPSPTSISSAFTPTNQLPSSLVEVSAPVATHESTVSVDATKTSKSGVSIRNGNLGTASLKHNPQKLSATANGSYARSSLQGGIPSGYQPDPRYAYNGNHSPIPWLNNSAFPDAQHRLAATSTVSSTVSHVGNNLSARSRNLNPLPCLTAHML